MEKSRIMKKHGRNDFSNYISSVQKHEFCTKTGCLEHSGIQRSSEYIFLPVKIPVFTSIHPFCTDEKPLQILFRPCFTQNSQKKLAAESFNTITGRHRKIPAEHTSPRRTRSWHKSFHPLRQTLIIPVTLSNEQYAAAWLAQKYKGRSFAADTPPLLTSKGERVRSKSEMLIADTLARMGVPYHYEYPLTLNDNGHTFTMNPDFLCLNLRTRQEFIWEHFGMMDDAAYSSKTVKKLRTYAQNGIYPGHNLITTAETTELPLNTRYLEKIITEYLK